MRRYFVYMLRCFDGTFYVGVTNDTVRRFAEHENGLNRHCYTYLRRPLRLLYVGEFERPDDAIAFEKRLKGWSHKKKRAFADRDWPLLECLARSRQGTSTEPVLPPHCEARCARAK